MQSSLLTQLICAWRIRSKTRSTKKPKKLKNHLAVILNNKGSVCCIAARVVVKLLQLKPKIMAHTNSKSAESLFSSATILFFRMRYLQGYEFDNSNSAYEKVKKTKQTKAKK
jgi:hypothetical protein